MAGMRNYETGLYKQLEEIITKLDEALKDNKTLKKENKELIKLIEKQQQESQETIQKLLNEIDRLKAIINKDSSNSSKPSSTNGFGRMLSQCILHILRYLKGIYNNVEHPASKKMAEFLQKNIITEKF